jgi:serine/threonine protein kinase
MVSTGSLSWNPDSLNGTRLGSCTLESPLTISSMGAVFLARQERPYRYVAVKVIHRHRASDSEDWQLFLTRFQREADATATLDHAHIMPIYEFGETGDLAYLVMPYLPDGSLASQLERQGPLPLPQTVQYVEQLASALDYAHACGIIHRDVKLSNMLLHPDGRVLLADFGIARPLHLPEPTSEPIPGPVSTGSTTSLTQASTAMGTPEYMAPEQVRAGTLTPATDQYGLGISAYELLGGQTPFGGGDVPTVLRRQLKSLPPSLRNLRQEVPASVEEVIFWALAKDPANRPASASQFARALRAAFETEPWDGGKVSGAAQSLQAASASGLDSAAAGLEGSIRQPLFPELTLPLPQSALPHASTEPEFAVDELRADQSTITFGPGGINRQGMRNQPAAVEGYASSRYPLGAPQWPVPQTGPDRRVAVAAVVGLAMSLVALIIVAALVVNSVQAALTTPGNTPRPSASALPTSTPIPSSAAAGAAAGGLVVSPTQVTLACQSAQSVTLDLANAGPEAVSWVAETSSSHHSSLDVQPASGTLAAGATQAIAVSVTSGKSNSGGQGAIQFSIVSGQQAGNLAQVTFTSTSCGGD